MTETEALPVALAGHGRWGRLIARDLPAAGGEVAAILVATEQSAAGLRDSRAAPIITTDPAGLLDSGAAAVVVATPAPSHESLARAALAAGKHVFVEKPLCLSGEAARELGAQARESGLVLMTGHVFLYHPAVSELKRLLAEGAVGEVESVSASWLNTEAQPGDLSALWSLGPHPLSVIAWLCGTDGVIVGASGDEDGMEISLSREDGWRGDVLVAWNVPERERSLTVRGSEGVAHFDGESGELSLDAGDGPPEPVACGREPALTAELRAFVEAVRLRKAPDQEGVTATVTRWLEQAAG